MTVSNAFSRPDQLSATLRRTILATAAELGYVGPDPAARALARGTAGAVGVLLTESLHYAFSDEVAVRFLGAVAEELAPTGLALTLLSSSSRDDVVPTRDLAMDGALVYSCAMTSDAVGWLIRRNLPLVFVDQAPAAGIPSVNIDDRSGARAAAEHVVALGHRRVAMLAPGLRLPGDVDAWDVADEHHVSRQRLLGWTDALHAAGVEPVVRRQPHNLESEAYENARDLLGAEDRPTAVLCFSDAIAVAVLHAADDLGLRVPDDLSVVGFDDSPLATRVRPALTTVRQDVAAKGRAAAAALTDAITRAKEERPAGRARHVLLPTELVVRDSTAVAPRR
jgi:DNA-binding LacI/PurR family transcriptional regulator